MTAWLHLRTDILQEFYEQGLLGRKSSRPKNIEAWLCAREEMVFRTPQSLAKDNRDFRKRMLRRRARRLVASTRSSCVWCGAVMEHDLAAVGGRVREFCSRKCSRKMQDEIRLARRALARRTQLAARTCPTCGKEIASDSSTVRRRYCGDQCGRRARRKEAA